MKKLACSRPLAEQNPARRQRPGARVATSLVSWPCRNLTASAPRARIKPQWVSGAIPVVQRACSWAIIISAHVSCLNPGPAPLRTVRLPAGGRTHASMRFWRRFLILSLIVLGALAGAVAWWLDRPLALASDPVELSIELGTSPREIAQQWVQAGVQASPTLLYEWFRWSGQSRKIRAGSYEIARGTTPMSLLNKMVRG